MGILYIVATPIGNLKDITLRALEVLKEVDLILAEDTRITKKLLFHYKIQKPLKHYDDHAKLGVYENIKKELQARKSLALVSDAGTPGISDPGVRLVSFVQKELPDVRIIAIPGPSALTTALSISGINADKFTFVGYPPHKKGRQKFFKALVEISIRPIILYESVHRLEKTLTALIDLLGEDQEIVVARELTKIYEEIFRGGIGNAQNYFQDEKKKGEFVLIVP